MKFAIPKGLGKLKAHKLLLAQKHSPTMLLAAGVVGVVATTVVACKATLKLEDVLQEDLDKINAVKNLELEAEREPARTHDLAMLYTRAGLNVVKLYAPAFVLGSLSIGCLVSSHRILSTRNASLVAAYGVLEKGFHEYRQRVSDEIGPEKERELRFPSSEEIDGPDGKKITVTPRKSGTARLFDETNANWKREHAYNQMFINCQQSVANDMLRAHGHLFLNDVYQLLGFERTPEGQLLGWLYEDQGKGDGYVDFGIFEDRDGAGFRFNTIDEKSVWLDFNYDGVIYDQI